uniref:Nitronate monooxygenase domain-containing protein n=1 Tax=Zea mays TaxID=4577 RepID=A0A804M1A2_MAIZE
MPPPSLHVHLPCDPPRSPPPQPTLRAINACAPFLRDSGRLAHPRKVRGPRPLFLYPHHPQSQPPSLLNQARRYVDQPDGEGSGRWQTRCGLQRRRGGAPSLLCGRALTPRDGRGYVATLALGAQGVCLGTRFVATEESFAYPIYKQKLIEMNQETEEDQPFIGHSIVHVVVRILDMGTSWLARTAMTCYALSPMAKVISYILTFASISQVIMDAAPSIMEKCDQAS